MPTSESAAKTQDHTILKQAASCLERLSAGSQARYELYLERRTSLKIDARDQEIDTFARSEDAGLSIRVLRHGRMGFSFTTSLELDDLERAARSAWETSEFMPEDAHQSLPSLGGPRIPSAASLGILDTEGPRVPTARKIEMALELEAKCRNSDPRIQAVRAAQLSELQYSHALLDSEGTLLQSSGTLYSASVTCKAADQGDSRMGGEAAYSPRLSELNLSAIAESAAKNATELLGAEKAPTLICPAVLRNDVMAELIDFLSSSFSAEQIDKGRSMLTLQSLDQPLFSPEITLVDDGILPSAPGTSPFDGEGTPCRTNTLVERGTIRRFLCDIYHSNKLGLNPTGSAGRGIKTPPSITTSNLILKPGLDTREELVAQIEKGILITDLMGVHTANPVTGDFSLGASGFLIEQGQISRPVSGFAVAGNVLELFKSVSAVSSDLKCFGTTAAPSALIPALSIGGNS